MSNNIKADELTQTIIETINERNPQNVKQLTAIIREGLPIKEERILGTIVKLQNHGKVKLENQPASTSKLGTYAEHETRSRG